ncbi:hypothetical protein [Streptomyces mirabilis]|uniref:hypothetical protein n=1 Tax=Streptomyces mirabilis TaxID=68239 RepID=UPI0036BA0C23
MDHKNLSAPACAQVSPVWAAEPSNLASAVSVAQKMLAAYGTVDSADSADIFAYAQAHGALTESLRIILRALGAEAGEGQ